MKGRPPRRTSRPRRAGPGPGPVRERGPELLRAIAGADREEGFGEEGAHPRPWSRGGETTLENLVLLCSFHHRPVHEEGWRLWRAVEGALLLLATAYARRRRSDAVLR